MRIETAYIKSNVIYTALLMHAAICVAVPACASISIFGRRSRRPGNTSISDKLFFDASFYTHYVIIISIIGIAIGFGVLYFRNHGKKYIVAVEFNDALQQLTFFYKTYYNNQLKKYSLPYSSLSFQARMGKANSALPRFQGSIDKIDNTPVDEKLKIFDSKNYVGEIAMGSTFWHKEGAKVKVILQKLEEISGYKNPNSN